MYNTYLIKYGVVSYMLIWRLLQGYLGGAPVILEKISNYGLGIMSWRMTQRHYMLNCSRVSLELA